ncbi:hypothetical protein [Streptomyces sp. MUSC 14]|uniref:hypothetical protein n=1 Tax=Streptomyces sp. MUSC 14 TaxID=1354889 RepID=UPI00116089BD|nr:hypothetical protein [Streptomyces sp. MUSC 14]
MSFHTNQQTGMRTVLLREGQEWVTAVVPKPFGPAPAEWWHGHYHGGSYESALHDFLGRSELTTQQRKFAQRAQSLLAEWEADADPSSGQRECDQEDAESATSSFEDRVISLLYDLADTLRGEPE